MPENTNNLKQKTTFPKMSERAIEIWKMARTRDETTNTFDCKCAGKDGKAFWFLMGYWIGNSE